MQAPGPERAGSSGSPTSPGHLHPVVVVKFSGCTRDKTSHSQATQPLHPIPSPAPRPPCPRSFHSIFLVNVPGHSHIRARRGSRISSIRKHQPQAHLLYHNLQGHRLGVGERKSLSLSGDPSKGSSRTSSNQHRHPVQRPCPPETPGDARITQKAGPVQQARRERRPRFPSPYR